MTEYQIRVKPGYRVKQSDAELIHEVIRELKEQGIPPIAENLLAYGRNPDSKIHHLWDWDKDKAAERDWQTRAAYLSRCYDLVEIEIETRLPGRQYPGTISIPLSIAYGVEEDEEGEKSNEPEVIFRTNDLLEDMEQNQHLIEFHIQELQQRLFSIRREYRVFEAILKEQSPGWQLILEGLDKIESEEAA